MGLVGQIQKDIQSIRGNPAGFGVSVLFEAPTSPVATATIYCTTKKHHTVFDEFGQQVRNKANTLNASVTVSTLSLNDANYPYRNNDARISFKGHYVTWADVTGTPIKYAVNEWLPNEQTGEIVLILGLYGTN